MNEREIERRARDIFDLTGQVTVADISRHLKEVMRETAKDCADIAENARSRLHLDGISGKVTSALDCCNRIERTILNTFLS